MNFTKVRPRLRTPWTLLGCVAVLAVVLGIENTRFSTALQAGQVASAAPAAAAVGRPSASFQPPPASRYLEIGERPLFIPERRPQQDVAAKPAAPAPPAPAILLQGVVLSPEGRYAVIQHGNPPKLDSVTEGTMVDGWLVEHIDTGKIALRSGNATADYLVGKPNAQTPQPIRPALPRPIPGRPPQQ